MAEISVRSVQVGRILDAYYLKMRISSVDGGVAAPDVRIHETHTELTQSNIWVFLLILEHTWRAFSLLVSLSSSGVVLSVICQHINVLSIQC